MSVNWTKIIIIALILFITGYFFIVIAINEDYETLDIRIAVCPTYSNLEELLTSNSYVVYKTNSTADSLKLLNDGKVDFVIAGRPPNSHEAFNTEIIYKNNSFSFMSNKYSVVYSGDLDKYDVYTDLPISELRNTFNIESAVQVDNVYVYLNEGIIITSWENTDYSKGEIVHVLLKNDKRDPNSRVPTIYSPLGTDIDNHLTNLVKEVYQ